MGAGVVKNIFLAETQNSIYYVYIHHKGTRIISHDVYIGPVGLKGLITSKN